MHFLSLLPFSISFFATCLFATCHLPALRHVLFTSSQWGRRNAVTYDTAKTKLVLFSRARQRRLNQHLRETTVLVGGKRIEFNKEATRWLGIWLDSQLKFTAHINERLTKAKSAEIQIKHLSTTYGLTPGLVQQIQITAI